MRHIYIKGPQGSGKTTKARALKLQLENDLLDVEHIREEDKFEWPPKRKPYHETVAYADVYIWDGIEPPKGINEYETIVMEKSDAPK